jgi:hypothetical protein
MECTLQMLKQKSLMKAGERATSTEDCRRVSVGVSVQCTMQRVQPDRGHHCGSKRDKRYDSTGLLTDK